METITWTYLLPGEALPTDGELVLITVEGTVRVSRYLGRLPLPFYPKDRPEYVPAWDGVDVGEMVLAWAYPHGISPATW